MVDVITRRHASPLGSSLLLLLLVGVAALSSSSSLLTGCGSANTHDRPRPTPLSAPEVIYTLHPEPERGRWAVEALLPTSNESLWFCAPAIGTRSGERLSWIGFDDERANDAASRWDEEGCFELPAAVLSRPLRLKYHVGTRPELRSAWRVSSLTPSATSEQLIFPGETLFPELRHLPPKTTFKVALSPIARARMASTLSEQSPHPAELRLIEQSHLLQSLFWWQAGVEHRSISLSHGDSASISIDPALDGVDPELLAAEVGCLASTLRQWAPGQSPTPLSVLVIKAGWDQDAADGFARRGGAVLQLGPRALKDRRRRLILLAHEIFHRYNGESLRFDPELYDETAWFREGVTSYVALMALWQSGLFDRETMLEVLAEHASSYQNGQASGWRGLERRRPYDRGVLLALALDSGLHRSSQGQRSLQGFWRSLSRSNEWATSQSNASLASFLGVYAHEDLERFFERFVEPRSALPVIGWLYESGFRAVRVRTEIPDHGVRLEYDRVTTQLVAQEVSKDGPAWRAGVRGGEVIEPLPETRLLSLDQPLVLAVERDGRRQRIEVEPRRRATTRLVLHPQPGSRWLEAASPGRCHLLP